MHFPSTWSTILRFIHCINLFIDEHFLMVGIFVSLISSLRAFSSSQITLPINVECCYVHCRAITTSSFLQKRHWSTPTVDSFSSDTTFLITVDVLSQQAFKIRLLTQTPTETLGTSAHCEQQDPGVPLICIWCQDEIQMGCESASHERTSMGGKSDCTDMFQPIYR